MYCYSLNDSLPRAPPTLLHLNSVGIMSCLIIMDVIDRYITNQPPPRPQVLYIDLYMLSTVTCLILCTRAVL